jgi:hypothetical protein
LQGSVSTLGNGSGSIGNTKASILAAGTLTASGTMTAMWRNRTTAEKLPTGTTPPLPAGISFLASDVFNLSGMPTGSGNEFVLNMTFDPTLFGTTADVQHAFNVGAIYLGYLSTNNSTGHNQWYNAIATSANGVSDGNSGIGTNAVTQFNGSWATFMNTLPANGGGEGESLQQLLGSWGVDLTNDTAWAVINHDNADFAVVPEPATWALLLAGGLGLVFVRRIRRQNA